MQCFQFAQNINALRKEAGLTLEEEAKLLSVKKSRASMWECGNVPRWEVLFQIADYYHVSIDFLLGHIPKEESLDCARL